MIPNPLCQRLIIVVPYTHTADFPKGIGRFSAHYKGILRVGKLLELGSFLEKVGYEVMVHPPLPAKELALRAGLGICKNCLFIPGNILLDKPAFYIDQCSLVHKGMETITDRDYDLYKACPNAIKADGQVTSANALDTICCHRILYPWISGTRLQQMLVVTSARWYVPNKKGDRKLLPAYDEMKI